MPKTYEFVLSPRCAIKVFRRRSPVGGNMLVSMMAIDASGEIKSRCAFAEGRSNVNSGELVIAPVAVASAEKEKAKVASEETEEVEAVEAKPAKAKAKDDAEAADEEKEEKEDKKDEKKDEKKDDDKEKGTWIRREFSYASYSQSFVIPENVEADQISAKMENGVLNITLPKKEVIETAPATKQIEIQ